MFQTKVVWIKEGQRVLLIWPWVASSQDWFF